LDSACVQGVSDSDRRSATHGHRSDCPVRRPPRLALDRTRTGARGSSRTRERDRGPGRSQGLREALWPRSVLPSTSQCAQPGRGQGSGSSPRAPLRPGASIGRLDGDPRTTSAPRLRCLARSSQATPRSLPELPSALPLLDRASRADWTLFGFAPLVATGRPQAHRATDARWLERI